MSSIAPVNVPSSGTRPPPTSSAGASSRPAVALPAANAPAAKPAQPAPPVVINAASVAAEAAVAANQAKKDRAAEELQKQLDQAMAQSQTKTSLRFRVDDEVNRIVVSVVDENGKTIVQIPNDTALALARRLAETGSGLLDRHA